MTIKSKETKMITFMLGRILLVTFIFAILSGCEDSTDPCKYFDEANLESLDFNNIQGFWPDGTSLFSTRNFGVSLRQDSNRIDGLLLGTVFQNRSVSVTVFIDQESAVAAGNRIRDNTQDGNDVINDTLGIYEGISWLMIPNKFTSAAVMLNKWNTLVFVERYNDDFNIVKDTLYSVAFELIDRIEQQCN